jgi:O-antigen/teichoic acid export membrane protein
VAAILAKAPYLAGCALSEAVFPFISRARDAQEAHGWFVAVFRWVPLALVPILLVLAVTPGSLILRFFPPEYADTLDLTRVIAVGTLGMIVVDMLVKALYARGLAAAAAVRVPVAVAAEVVTMVVLVPGHGVLGGAIGYAVGAWTGVGVVAGLYLRHHRAGRLPLRRVAGWATATTVLVGLLAAAAASGPAFDVALVALAFVAYGGLAVLLGAVPSEDVARARGVLVRLVGRRPVPVGVAEVV